MLGWSGSVVPTLASNTLVPSGNFACGLSVIVSVARSTTPLWTTGEAKFFFVGSAIPRWLELARRCDRTVTTSAAVCSDLLVDDCSRGPRRHRQHDCRRGQSRGENQSRSPHRRTPSTHHDPTGRGRASLPRGAHAVQIVVSGESSTAVISTRRPTIDSGGRLHETDTNLSPKEGDEAAPRPGSASLRR